MLASIQKPSRFEHKMKEKEEEERKEGKKKMKEERASRLRNALSFEPSITEI
jgi:hypothetical protein